MPFAVRGIIDCVVRAWHVCIHAYALGHTQSHARSLSKAIEDSRFPFATEY